MAASARERTLSARSHSSEERPTSRKERSTPSRLASHSSVSFVGRVAPRSIPLTYCFVKRSPARSACVRPRAIRSWRTRSPSVDGLAGTGSARDSWIGVRCTLSLGSGGGGGCGFRPLLREAGEDHPPEIAQDNTDFLKVKRAGKAILSLA